MAAAQQFAAVLENAERSWLQSQIRADRFEDVLWMVSAGVEDCVISLLRESRTAELRGEVERELRIARAYLLDPTSNRSSTLTTSLGGSSVTSLAASHNNAASDTFQYSG
ncbi:hypothetical protein LTR97_002849 [Elasticomyces elasticus]|uniref:Uncharacterized protein n=1 Tax=Elasticomyces elasticus TaxID=574655 RepID=A0AAN7W911_9PEZI|nr:hypothetical protein LTR42_001194 [Elasticomyces elasticus]KAK5703836.1 hypothetical protein LTR97_002849 [Elasticomyces elasticus]